MTEDLGTTNRDYAIFLPAISRNYAQYAGTDYTLSRIGPEGDMAARCPPGFQGHGRELNFLDPECGNYFYPFALYSAGHAGLNLEKSQEYMIHRRDRKNTLIVGDSGGYQVARGVIKFDWNDRTGPTAEKLKMDILRWLEATADYSMILDVPTYSIINSKKTGITEFKQCIDATMENLDFFVKNRVEGATNFLNVLQGRNKEESDIWYEAVKDYPFEGWAFGGYNCSDFELILRRLITMRDEKRIGKDKHWLHYLGNSRLPSACAFTTVQRILRETVDENITISFDSSSPFLGTAKGFVYTRNSYDKRKMSFIMEKMVDDKSIAKSELPFPWQDTPIGRMLRVGDICVKGKDIDSKSSWDTWSYISIMNHNVCMQIKATQQAVRLYDLPRSQNSEWVPANLMEFKDLAKEVFTSEKPMELIDSHHKLLNNLIGLKLGRRVSASENKGLFDFDQDVIDTETLDVAGERTDMIDIKEE